MNKKINNVEIKEYEFLRAEILQYLEEYQSVRNMMYVITVAILGFSNSTQKSAYFFLLPLVVILPSYMITYDYRFSVMRAATYLQVFYEAENSFQWESRLKIFHVKYRKQYPWKAGTPYGQFPYIFCGIVCLVFYFSKLGILDLLCGEGITFQKLFDFCVRKNGRVNNRNFSGSNMYSCVFYLL